MSISGIEVRNPTALRVIVTDDTLTVDLADGRIISVPIAWFPRLLHGAPEERSSWVFIADSEGIHWPGLDEDLSVGSLLAGRPSGESQESLRRWLNGREKTRIAESSPTTRKTETSQGCQCYLFGVRRLSGDSPSSPFGQARGQDCLRLVRLGIS
jgi:hypothetical protein